MVWGRGEGPFAPEDPVTRGDGRGLPGILRLLRAPGIQEERMLSGAIPYRSLARCTPLGRHQGPDGRLRYTVFGVMAARVQGLWPRCGHRLTSTPPPC